MDPVPTDVPQKEQRILAAIVFTDVVGFSKLASQNEARVYSALQRDMGVMTAICRNHGGQVLNTMGDGMLLCFKSAVDAMSCATEIQSTLFHQAQSLPPQDILEHRIGVHLGDVILAGDNVFGDGVNVAARLQAAAKPGSICFSHTVHDVIKNKLILNQVYIGQQQLKNLGEPVKMWQIPPLADAVKKAHADAVQLPPLENDDAVQGIGGFKGIAMVAASLLLVGVVVGGVLTFRPKPSAAKPKPKVEAVAPEQTSTSETAPPIAATQTPEQVESQAETLRRGYQFDALVALLNSDGAKVPAVRAKLQTFAQLAQLRDYLDSQMALTSASNPVRLQVDGAATTVYGQGEQLFIDSGTGFTPVAWSQLSPSQFGAIAASLAQRRVDGNAPPAEAADWTRLFGQEFGVSVPL